MYIKEITISNIKCFGEGDLKAAVDFSRPDGTYAGWTVLAGLNGSGKSTLLRAMALAVAGEKTAYSLQKRFKGWPRFDAGQGGVSVTIVPHEKDTFEMGSETGSPPQIKPFDLKFVCSYSTSDQLMQHEPILVWDMFDSKGNTLTAKKDDGPWNRNPKGWLIAGYGPFRRLSHSAPDSPSTDDLLRREAQLQGLFDSEVPLTMPIPWLKSINHRELEGDEDAKRLMKGIKAFLNDGLLPGNMTVDKIDSKGLWVNTNGHPLLINDLSDGYRTVTALVLDIIRQLFETYGEFLVTEEGDGTCHADYPGVILIDEMDTHMHPSWQQEIGFWLKRHFPRIQFIVTTHSPFICQAADPKGLIRLPAAGEERPVEHGSVDEAVLTELFGLDTPHSKVSEKIRDNVACLETIREFPEIRDWGHEL